MQPHRVKDLPPRPAPPAAAPPLRAEPVEVGDFVDKRPQAAVPLGVVSIVVAGLTIALGGVATLVLLFYAGTTAARVPIPTGPIATGIPAVADVGTDAIVEGFSTKTDFTEAQEAQLRRLLAEHAAKVVPYTGPSLTPEAAADAVADVAAEDGVVRLQTAQGVLTVTDDAAVFTDEAFNVYEPLAGPNPAADPMYAYYALPADEADAVVTEAHLRHNLTPAQERALHRDLTDPRPSLYMAYPSNDLKAAAMQVVDAGPGEAPGSVRVVLQLGVWESDEDATATTWLAGGPTIAPADSHLPWLAATGQGLVAALGLLLLAAGIQTVRLRPMGRTLHLLHAGLAVAAGAAAGVFLWRLLDANAAGQPAQTLVPLLLAGAPALYALAAAALLTLPPIGPKYRAWGGQ